MNSSVEEEKAARAAALASQPAKARCAASTGPVKVSRGMPTGEGADRAAALAAEFAAAHYDDVLRYCRRRLPSWDDAQDATQEAFLRLVRSGARYERRGKPLAYLYTIARNVCAEAYRRCGPAMEPLEVDVPDPAADRTAERLALDAALATLSADERDVLELRYGQGLAVGEIAMVMERSRFAVRRLEQKALATLKQEWEG